MRAAWMFLLVGCGFQSRAASNSDDAGGGTPDAAAVDLSPICPSVALGVPLFHASACATPTAPSIKVSTSTSIDTDQGTSEPAGLTCAKVLNGEANLCVLVAPTIAIAAGVSVSAHGSAPFAIFAHALTIHGTVDVASHIGGAVGAGSLQSGCVPGTLPSGGGGGRGGAAAELGGRGGDDGSSSMTGATGGGTFSFGDLSGGCGGTRGGNGASAAASDDGGTPTGGFGGGVVWLVSDTADLVIDSGASINASGASGAAGGTAGHGGAGGGAGGLIVLQAPNIQLDPAAMVFANGGHGGGGAGTMTGFSGGADGSDPTGPMSGGDGGTGGADGSIASGDVGGDGGPGFPSPMRDGKKGMSDMHGGGGGGGGPGAIRVVSANNIAGTNVSPKSIRLQ